jgi:hypothetical protein
VSCVLIGSFSIILYGQADLPWLQFLPVVTAAL